VRDQESSYADLAVVGLLTRHRLPAAICGAAIVAVSGFFLFARPQYRPPHQGETIRIPEKHPAADATGRAGWTWSDGVPGWEPGYKLEDFNVSEIQAIEAEPAQLSAAHAGLDANGVRVLAALHASPTEGPLAVFAAPQRDATPAITCLAAMLPSGAPMKWRCPGATAPYGDVARSYVLVAAAAQAWPHNPTDRNPITDGYDLVGVARGDVKRVVLRIVGDPHFPSDTALYDRGKTWGQFSAAVAVHGEHVRPELRVYGDHGLVQVLRLDVGPGEARIYG
jgi:hypothetical protein